MGVMVEPAQEPAAASDAGGADDDAALVRRIVGGGDAGHDAFRLLYARHAPDAARFLRRMLDDAAAADDALQETFVRVHRGLGGFEPGRPLRPWVLGIARHAALGALRAKQRAAKLSALGAVDPPDPRAAGDAAGARDMRARVLEAVSALAPEHREVVLLRLAHGLLLADVARALAVTERTVRNRLRAAVVLLERELRRRGLDQGDLP